MKIKEYKHYLDIHCHYDHLTFQKIKEDLEKENIISIVNTINLKDYNKYQEIKKENIPTLYFAHGLYPDNVLKKEWKELEEELLKIDFKEALAIGEIGLDLKITSDPDKINLQKKLFEKQLEIAEKLKKPVIVHTRGATKETLEVLKNWQNVQVILHWFTGTDDEIKEALSRRYFLTQRFARPYIENIENYLNQIFIETDVPVWYNGKETEIKSIKESYEVFCKKYNIPLEKTKERMINNFLKLFPNINI